MTAPIDSSSKRGSAHRAGRARRPRHLPEGLPTQVSKASAQVIIQVAELLLDGDRRFDRRVANVFQNYVRDWLKLDLEPEGYDDVILKMLTLQAKSWPHEDGVEVEFANTR